MIERPKIHHIDSFEGASLYPNGHFQLLLTSTPYPGHRGFDITCAQYVNEWLPDFLSTWVPKMHPVTGVIVQNIVFYRGSDPFFPIELFDIPRAYAQAGLGMINPYIWDKLNAPPSGNHSANDRQGWEFVFSHALTPDYTWNQQRAPYKDSTVKNRQYDRGFGVNGNLGGGHNRLHPQGALQDNVLRVSSSGDVGRPRAKGGSFPRRLATRMIRQFSDPGDVVVDPFLGAGTTIMQAMINGRQAVGFDIDKDEIDKAKKWIDDHLGVGGQSRMML